MRGGQGWLLLWVLCHLTGFARLVWGWSKGSLPHSEWFVYCLFVRRCVLFICASRRTNGKRVFKMTTVPALIDRRIDLLRTVNPWMALSSSRLHNLRMLDGAGDGIGWLQLVGSIKMFCFVHHEMHRLVFGICKFFPSKLFFWMYIYTYTHVHVWERIRPVSYRSIFMLRTKVRNYLAR